MLALPRKAAINFHDGPLPRYAGMYTPAWALIHGETEYGVTFHEMTLGADEGDIYVQRLFEIAPDDTSLTLNTRCYEAAIDAFGELVDRIREGRLEKRPQDLRERSYFGRHIARRSPRSSIGAVPQTSSRASCAPWTSGATRTPSPARACAMRSDSISCAPHARSTPRRRADSVPRRDRSWPSTRAA